ncbi:MAG: chemotaxis protein CheW [Desulfobacterales bacterium]|uniref:histidine kinase n=1 Tax=Candidatus Desulfatibia vada TaxID=2841696 RepID=A0A8J6TT13_9BACT|nr:chemotaxis protein CheW [Candidatus Desulfatibia vada]MBL6970789.1 chemotaxis protein CheW [Desulfobacterales bacterium]
MSIENDDDTIQIFIQESLEHLANIENDFLAIEGAGVNLDKELINKVYRTAHSIKGGAGFMGLTNIKNLTHEMENILGKFRSSELTPDPGSINILLLASDTLRDLINNINTSNEVDISEHIEALSAINKASLLEEEKTPAFEMIDITFPDGKHGLTVAADEISSSWKEGKYICLLEIDLIQDVHLKGKTPQGFLDEIQECGEILGRRLDVDAVGALDQEGLPDQLPLIALFATVLQPNDINALLEINEQSIYELADDMSVKSVEQKVLEESLESATEEAMTTAKDDFIEETQEQSSVLTESSFQKAGVETQQQKKSVAVESSLRVNISLLDSLMTLAGELVLCRNQLIQSISSNEHHTPEIAIQRIDLITSELQEAIMLTRMQSIGNVFNKFPRVVRNLARNLDKQVELSLEGKEVELDKTIIEAIGDPLTHLVRNAVDHGIEMPDDRRKAGKDTSGRIFLKAYHEAGQVNVAISDDGKGLDGNKLAIAAVAKGLITDDQAKMMSEKEKINLIFMPGFSTAEKVTDVSGRGVGMDVVKTNLDKLGGVVDIDSELGKGTTIRIKLPLTLAIIPCQIIVTGGERYAIPQVNLEELIRIPAGQVKDKIEMVGDAEVVRLRGDLLPLIHLADTINVERTYFDSDKQELKSDRRDSIADRRSHKSPLFDEDQPKTKDSKLEIQNPQHQARSPQDRRYHAASALHIVVVTTGAMKYGLVVDRLNDSEEIVVKPLGRHLKHCKGYAGATIMGDGRVAIILDVGNIARMAGLISLEGTDRAVKVSKETDDAAIKANKDKQSLLVFRSAENEQFAVALNLVERIEKIKKTAIEEVGGKRVMQYRGRSLPLFAIDEVAQVKPLANKEDLLVIVFTLVDKEIGLLAMGPVDATEISAEVDGSTLKQPGILGSVIIGNHTTLLVDIFGFVQALNPEWFSGHKMVTTLDGEAPTVLYAEDSNFFRNQIKDFIEDVGYNVIAAEDGMIAWNLLQEHGEKVALVITDIEMPNLNGYDLTAKIRHDNRFSGLPIIAVTSMAGDEEIAKGKAVGVNEYQIKLDKEKLIGSLHHYLQSK